MHSLKGENYVFLGGFSEGLSPEDSNSDNSEGLLQRSKGGARIYSFFNKNHVVGTPKDDCSLQKTRYLKLINLVLFYVWEDARVWAH